MTVVSTAFPPDRVSRGTAIKTGYQNIDGKQVSVRPSRIPVIGVGSDASTYPTVKEQVFSAEYVGAKYGYGSPLHLAVDQLLPASGDGVGTIPVTVYPLANPGGGAASAGSVTPSGTATKTQQYNVKINNIKSEAITIVKTETVADFITKAVTAINNVLKMPVIASDGTTTLNIVAKWLGTNGDECVIEIESPDDAEITFAITQPTGGSGDVTPTDSLSQIGNIWESHIVNCLEADTDNYDEYSEFNEGRWLSTSHKPLVVVSGTNEANVNTASAITDARKSDRTNCLVPNPGSNDLPWVIAARAVARAATVANAKPARDYGRQKLTGLTPGADNVQWTDAQMETAVKKGLSTTRVEDGVVKMSDLVTMYHPVGEEPPPYRYVCDIQKISAMIYSIDQLFNNEEWDGAPLVEDDQELDEPDAKKPKDARTALNNLYDSAGRRAILTDVDYAQKNSTAGIDGTNPKRLNINANYKISGNVNVISIDMNFAFNFGG